MPNTYARGILFGKMILELGDISSIRNEELDYRCDVDFRTKVSSDIWPRRVAALDVILIVQGWISGGYNVIFGQVKGPDSYHVGDITGHWNDVIEYHDKKKGNRVMFDAKTAKNAPKSVLPESEQEENESRRWVHLPITSLSNDRLG